MINFNLYFIYTMVAIAQSYRIQAKHSFFLFFFTNGTVTREFLAIRWAWITSQRQDCQLHLRHAKMDTF